MRLDLLSNLEAILDAGSPDHPFLLVSGSFALKIHKNLKVAYIAALMQVCTVHCT